MIVNLTVTLEDNYNGKVVQLPVIIRKYAKIAMEKEERGLPSVETVMEKEE